MVAGVAWFAKEINVRFNKTNIPVVMERGKVFGKKIGPCLPPQKRVEVLKMADFLCLIVSLLVLVFKGFLNDAFLLVSSVCFDVLCCEVWPKLFVTSYPDRERLTPFQGLKVSD